ncbi:hypothetical protein BAE44_0007292 [Dichanthelium oligosanthes]|uniref:Uncharacterized protein n=1 Tax=Dichanthelium oligosanthes TaxID=888268 RepID=A0A1E5W320_9POAL|nr:hypothetical protein BAE44_0007292 [Dichanthelium oligosanthes]
MAAERLYRPKARSFWILVRRLLLRRSRRTPPARGAEEDRKEEKSGLLSRSSLEQLLVTDAGSPGDGDVCQSAKKNGQPVAVLLARPEAAAVSSATAVGGRDGGAVHRRFAFGGFRRRLLMRRPWRPVLVAIPESE